MDTKLSVALHMLIYISESKSVATSERLAKSVKTNSSYIRKITIFLKQADIIDSQQGKSGFSLVKDPSEITLKAVYKAVYPERKLLYVHQDANPNCAIGSRIEKIVSPIFDEAENSLLNDLEKKTLSDLIAEMYTID